RGPDHAKVFTMEVRVNGKQLGQGTGRSKKEAEQAAAKAALELLAQENNG
ncbi:MAG: ribonuclease III, partial [Oscillibacter sp.]|nr:ribonuclease III [Oscillibacter sp.]